LKDYPPEAVSQRSFRLNRAQTLARISSLEQLIQARSPRTTQDEAVLVQLVGQQTWLLQQAHAQESTLLMEAPQVIHGDYQSTNLFFAAHQVCAIIDWDQAYVASRAWEVMRTLDLVCQFTGPLSRAFLQGYRSHAALSLAALDQAAAAYGLMRAHDVWPYEAVYVEGNDRVRQFLKPGGFVPLIERWGAVRPELT
jgi:homoserine kinase type II